MIHVCDHSHQGNYAVVIYQDRAGCPICTDNEELEYQIPPDLITPFEDLIDKAEAVVGSKGGDLWENEDIKELAEASEEAKEKLRWATQ